MNVPESVLEAVRNLPERDRVELAMAILDEASPAALEESEIAQESARRQDELESGRAQSLSYEELLSGVRSRPSGTQG